MFYAFKKDKSYEGLKLILDFIILIANLGNRK